MKPELKIKLKTTRTKLNLTQAQMAAALGVPHTTYLNWEQGHRTPRGLAVDALQARLAALLKK